ncbi:MAG: response regulator [Armatimonadetes bacterium]|nr:response regulator [Armatimonadota bacterium]
MAAKILIVDDAPDYAYALRGFLEDLGYEVVEAYDGEEALEVLEREEPDLVLLDVIMPVRDGWETLTEIRKRPRWQDLPVIMLTGLDQPQHMMESYDRGCTDFVAKSTADYDQLSLIIDRLLKIAERQKQAREQGEQ